MKILVIGGSGVIGWKLVDFFSKRGSDVEFTFFNNKPFRNLGKFLDIRQQDATTEFIAKERPDVVIHTTAITNVDLCEQDEVLAKAVNVEGTKNVVEGCKLCKCKLVFVSTSAVFGGKHDQYYEDNHTSPINTYGLTKSMAEEIAKGSGLEYLILRTDQPYCWIEKWQHTNSVLRAIESLASGNTLREITDWCNSPTYVPDFVHAVQFLINNNECGVYHLVGSDYLSRFDMSIKVAQIFGLNKKFITPINSQELGLAAKRDSSRLNNDKFFNKCKTKMVGAEEGLHRMLLDKVY